MALFRRGKDSAQQQDPTTEQAPEVEERTMGPWDRSEVPDPQGRIDLGALWLPGVDGMELRLEVDQTNGSVVGVTAAVGQSTLQLQAFAAPRTLGIWDDIRDEIAESIRRSGGTADVVESPLGTELAVQLVQNDAYGRRVLVPATFLGVDGPRWFLRGFLSGPAVTDAEQGALLRAVFADTVVVRGDQAMAPRDLLPLKLPEQTEARPTSPVPGQATDQGVEAGQGGQDAEPGRSTDDLKPFERGPEITEVR